MSLEKGKTSYIEIENSLISSEKFGSVKRSFENRYKFSTKSSDSLTKINNYKETWFTDIFPIGTTIKDFLSIKVNEIIVENTPFDVVIENTENPFVFIKNNSKANINIIMEVCGDWLEIQPLSFIKKYSADYDFKRYHIDSKTMSFELPNNLPAFRIDMAINKTALKKGQNSAILLFYFNKYRLTVNIELYSKQESHIPACLVSCSWNHLGKLYYYTNECIKASLEGGEKIKINGLFTAAISLRDQGKCLFVSDNGYFDSTEEIISEDQPTKFYAYFNRKFNDMPHGIYDDIIHLSFNGTDYRFKILVEKVEIITDKNELSFDKTYVNFKYPNKFILRDKISFKVTNSAKEPLNLIIESEAAVNFDNKSGEKVKILYDKYNSLVFKKDGILKDKKNNDYTVFFEFIVNEKDFVRNDISVMEQQIEKTVIVKDFWIIEKETCIKKKVRIKYSFNILSDLDNIMIENNDASNNELIFWGNESEDLIVKITSFEKFPVLIRKIDVDEKNKAKIKCYVANIEKLAIRSGGASGFDSLPTELPANGMVKIKLKLENSDFEKFFVWNTSPKKIKIGFDIGYENCPTPYIELPYSYRMPLSRAATIYFVELVIIIFMIYINYKSYH